MNIMEFIGYTLLIGCVIIVMYYVLKWFFKIEEKDVRDSIVLYLLRCKEDSEDYNYCIGLLAKGKFTEKDKKDALKFLAGVNV